MQTIFIEVCRLEDRPKSYRILEILNGVVEDLAVEHAAFDFSNPKAWPIEETSIISAVRQSCENDRNP